jgi:hypothetical protein
MKGSQLRENAKGQGVVSRLSARKLVVLAGLATGAAMLVPSVATAATTDPVTVAVSYTSPDVNPGAPETITYAIQNSSNAAVFANLTDQLPSGVTIDAAPSETWTSGCGTNDDTNAGGATSVTIANINLGASGSTTATCDVTLSVDVAQSAVGKTETNVLQSLSWAASSGGTATSASDLAVDETTPVPLVVVANPTVAITGVTSGAKYSYGKPVVVNYTATAATDDSIAGLTAFDSFGDSINSPGYINTLQTGKQTFSVQVNTADGASITRNVSYTVESPTLTKVTTSKKGSASYKIALPWAGKLSSELLDGKKVVGTLSTTVKAKETASATVKLNATGKKDLKKAGKKGLKLTLQASFTPSGSVATSWPTPATAEGFAPGKAVAKATVTIK